MISLLKDGAKDIENYVDYIKKQPWLSLSQKWWPNCLFNFTDITNAIKILTDGKLLSRFELEKIVNLLILQVLMLYLIRKKNGKNILVYILDLERPLNTVMRDFVLKMN